MEIRSASKEGGIGALQKKEGTMSQISRRLLMAAAGLGLLGVAPTTAQAQGFLLDLYAGVGLPTGRLNDLTGAGFSGGLGLGYVFNRALGIRADFAGEWL